MNYCECPECGFDFMCKWSRFSTTENPECLILFMVLCRTCLDEFFVASRSPGIPGAGDMLDLCTIEVLEWNTTDTWRAPYPKRTRLVRTGASTRVVDRRLPLRDMADFSQLACPSCATHGDIGHLPKPGLCPKCEQAELRWGVVE